MNKLKRLMMAISLGMLPVSMVYAAEMDHSQHEGMDHSDMQHALSQPLYTTTGKKGSLQKLTELPASGEAREAGSDGRYAMEPTSVNDDIRTKCAKASRGLVMVDNKTWEKCGGKPMGWSEGPGDSKAMDHSQHMMQ